MSFIKRVAIITGFLALFLGFFVGTLCPAQYLPWKERETAMTPSVVNSIIVSAGSASASGSSSANTLPAFNSSDNFPLLSSACAVVRAIQERDWNDTHRAAAPLRQAEDAVLLDNSDFTFQQSVERLVGLVRERL